MHFEDRYDRDFESYRNAVPDILEETGLGLRKEVQRRLSAERDRNEPGEGVDLTCRDQNAPSGDEVDN